MLELYELSYVMYEEYVNIIKQLQEGRISQDDVIYYCQSLQKMFNQKNNEIKAAILVQYNLDKQLYLD